MSRWSIYFLTLAFFLAKRCFGLDQTQCQEPKLNTLIFEEIKNNGFCTLLKNVCTDDGMLVTFDSAYVADNLTRASPYGGMATHTGLWNFPARGGANSDALVGHQPTNYVQIRSASRMEASPHLQHRAFSKCTMPVIMITDWPYNMGEVFAQLASVADVFFRQKGMIDDLATLVLATPDGLGLTSFHHVLLSPYSRYPLISLDELSQRPVRDRHVAWSAEGHHVSCFQRVVLCKIHGSPQGMLATGQVVLRHIAPRLPPDPMGFGAEPVATHSTLRVLIESRSGPTRNIRNLQQIVEACEQENAKGFKAGSFNHLSCKILHTGDTPTLYGVERFYTTVAAVRSAHVLAAVHGAGATNSFFMESDNVSTAMLEIRPCRFGSKHCGWPNAYVQHQLRVAGFPIRFFSLNIEDPAQCHPSDYEAAALASPADTPMRGAEDMRARDQHMTLRPGAFLAMLRHMGALLRNDSAWRSADAAGALHGYVVPEGLVLGGMCEQNMTQHLANGATLIRV
ncbi:hypothetical protein PLESTF_000598700 [Pleodorina starrii]|nr:hypothetical protein PLESTM_001772000 [Pleodorina starrii]GLC67722.1 hypothetical protein PLESTF_000598700 [Pleodorina starrii]